VNHTLENEDFIKEIIASNYGPRSNNCDSFGRHLHSSLIFYPLLLTFEQFNSLVDNAKTNNTLKHFHLNLTKKRVHLEKTEKSMNINKYINESCANNICIIHGISSLIKTIDLSENIVVLSGDNTDDVLIQVYKNIGNKKNIKLLKYWLDKIIDPKESHKLVFGKDIGSCIIDCSLKTIFCSLERKTKILENFGKEHKIPELIVILKDDNDFTCRQFFEDFKGGLGIKYY
jgi:hypothetical protein